jgi:tRNA(Ile)-lysidine synthase
LRHELIPNLETYNPAVRKLIWRTAEIVRGESELIDRLVDAVWEDCLLTQDKVYIAIDALYCSRQPLSMQRHMLRRAIAYLRPGLRDISFNAIEKGLEYLQPSKPFAEVDLISGLKLVAEPGRLWIAEWAADIPVNEWPQVDEESRILEIGETINLQAGWQLSAEALINSQTQHSPWMEVGAYQVWVDRAQIQSPLLVRSRKEGDRLQPYGMDGQSLKLSDFMINQKLPRRARERWPLVCCGEQIVWVPGYRLAHPFRVSESTTEMVNLILTKENL